MSAWVGYEGRGALAAWGRSPRTILRLPPEISRRLSAKRAGRMEAEINEHPVNLSLTRAPASRSLLYLIASMQTLATQTRRINTMIVGPAE